MSVLSLLFVFFAMPEVSGMPLERIKELFDNKPWYLVGCTQNRPIRLRDDQVGGSAAQQEAGDVPRLGREKEELEENDLSAKKQDDVLTSTKSAA